jgi:hypothetical protein
MEDNKNLCDLKNKDDHNENLKLKQETDDE